MNATHTPGPWVVVDAREKGHGLWVETEKQTLKSGTGICVLTGYVGEVERIANAHAIAAMPDLLDVAIGVAGLAELLGDHHHLVISANAAVAKAAGQAAA